MDTKYPTKRIAESLVKDGKGAIANEAIEQLANDYLTQCQEVERLKELLCVAQDYLKQHWDMRSLPLYEIDDIANKHIEEALKDKQ